MRGILGGWLEPHPLAEGGLAVAAFMETPKADKPPRRIQDSLALGMMLRARRARTLCFVAPADGANWSDFRERWHLQAAGNGYGREFDPPENEADRREDGRGWMRKLKNRSEPEKAL